MEIKKSTFQILGIFIMVILGATFLIGESSTEKVPTNDVIEAQNGDVQEIVLGMRDYNYYPEKITVEAGRPVRISADNTVGGCFRDLTIRGLGQAKYLQTTDDYLEFTPTKPGKYTFACSMGMGSGTLIVK